MMRKVLEKFKNKKVFALYLVGVLLFSTGISFAYFTARTNAEGEGGVATATTTTVTSQGITADGNIEFNNVDMYPGHTAIASIEVTGIGDNEPLMYNVIFNGTNTFNSPLNYTVYKGESNIEASYTCTNKNDYISGGKTYYEECVGNNIESLGSPISSGTINNGEGKTILKSDEIMLTIPEGKVVYYYIVIEYPNLDTNQNDDMGSSISGNITIEEGNEYQKPQVILTGSTTAGSNGWVQSASITTNITTHTGKYEAYYCTTTSDSCTPNTPANGSNNSFTTTLSSNASPQKVCVRVIDEYNQTAERCSDAYYIDDVLPTSNVTIASSTVGSNNWYQALTFRVSGSDSHSGVSSIRYCTTTSSSCTPSTTVNGISTNVALSSNASAQRVCVQAIDNVGNTSSTTCSSAYSVDTTSPTVSITSTSVTENSISVTVSGSDAHSGISEYRFSSNGGNSYIIVSSTNSSYTYTFTGLNSGTNYNIAVQSVDRSGRTSSRVTRSITTEEAGNTMQEILAEYNKSIRPNIGNIYTESTTKQVFTAIDWTNNTSYYFAGQPTDNWVFFGGFYWRIIRMNGDGSIRLIYNGTSTTATGNETLIDTTVFNNRYNYSYYVGLSYSTSQHGSGTPSTLLSVLNNWYSNSNLDNYAKYIDSNIGFCSDRNITSENWNAMEMHYYAAYSRIPKGQSNANPVLQCSSNDILKIPIGLITADEAAFAGLMVGTSNKNNYLYNATAYWTMTPNRYSSDYAVVYIVYGDNLADSDVGTKRGARPVINLKADTLFTGTGTSTDPYQVVM